MQGKTQYAWFERFLRLFIQFQPGEARGALLFFCYALLLMSCYYIVKTLREPLLLSTASAEIKSYAYAVIAVALFFLVPLYGALFRHTGKMQLTRYITVLFVAVMLVFYLLARTGADVGFAYYVWVGIFGVLITAQFWAFAADTYNVQSGQQLFPFIMIGATLGGVAAPPLVGTLFPVLGASQLMLIAIVLLAATWPLIGWARQAVPEKYRNHYNHPESTRRHLLSGFHHVFKEPYLLLLAILVVLLNWINTTGEYILAELVVRFADSQVNSNEALTKGEIVAAFYGNFYFVVNIVTVLLQVFLVSKLFRWIGIRGAILLLPILVFIGYGLVVFVPIFSVVRLVKILENSTEYSVMNTTRQALYLPLPAAQKYEGKITIDCFFWRFGDLIQAGFIYAGLNWLSFDVEHFAILNMLLAIIWFIVAYRIGQIYVENEKEQTA